MDENEIALPLSVVSFAKHITVQKDQQDEKVIPTVDESEIITRDDNEGGINAEFNNIEQNTEEVHAESTEKVIPTVDESEIITGDDNEGGINAEFNNIEQNTEEIHAESTEINGSLLGFKIKTVDEMLELYCTHARCVGFSVRKSTNRFSSKGDLLAKQFVCSNAGMKKDSNDSKEKIIKKQITRTNCPALLKVTKNEEGLFEVTRHVVLHNHDLIRIELNHFHRSERRITNEMGEAITNMVASGIKPMDCYRYMVHEAGGEENIGHTRKDHMNYISRMKMEEIEGGDANSLIEMLQEENEENSGFFYRVKLKDGRLCNIFWRDSMMLEDFDVYGDVVVFDTTYRTNRYNLICAPFVGINNHWKNVMFGCAFLSDEKVESFEWLFTVFKKSMKGKSPSTLFTDQDFAISKAIEKVFPETRHRLCQWHLQQNAITRFASLKSNKLFKDEFKKCLSGCIDEIEFESCWNNMISTYGLQNNEWFARLYSLRDKWCTALSKDFFSAGILSSQRSESTNNAISFNAKKTTSLIDFYRIFKETVTNWRSNEQYDEYMCLRSMPESTLPMTGIIKQAAEVYTTKLFRKFEEEFNSSISSYSDLIGCYEGTMIYNISPSITEGPQSRVIYDRNMKMITCSCMKFEECGILCYHCLRVLHINSVQSIPEIYIKKRWTKLAKSEIWEKFKRGDIETEINQVGIQWRNQLLRKYYNLILKSQENEETRRIMEEGYERDSKAIYSILKASELVIPLSSNTILDPASSTTKGRRAKRAKSQLEKGKKKRGKSIPNHNNEFGTKTPNVHII